MLVILREGFHHKGWFSSQGIYLKGWFLTQLMLFIEIVGLYFKRWFSTEEMVFNLRDDF